MSGLSAPFVVLLVSSCFSALCEGTKNATAKTGVDVTLPCQKDTDESIIFIEWSRPDLQSDGYVFYFRGNRLYEDLQLPSFRGRVELKDPEMKSGDASVILKNVSVNDTGTYECVVRTNSSGRSKRQDEFRQSVALEVTGTKNVTAKAGEDVTLPCQKDTDESIIVIDWSRPDLKTNDHVFLFRDNRLYENYQLPSFRGRVELRDPEMKNGDASVILKNVTVNDTGTYQCVVLTGSSGEIKTQTVLTQSVTLKVTESGHTARDTAEGGDGEGRNLPIYLAAGLITAAVVIFVGAFVLWKRQRSQGQNSPPPAEAELQTLSAPSSNHYSVSERSLNCVFLNAPETQLIVESLSEDVKYRRLSR